ncbi:MAG TPA: phosphoserine phosphatase SerB [Casimicrobiaceae bacterium]|nr:phosphoserine phosphatase SerB [Casimicrobiaceae bacterium]
MTPATASATRLVVQAPDIATPALKALAKLAGAERIDAASRGADQGFTLAPAGNAGEVAAYCAQAKLDCAFVPLAQRLDRVRLLAMDMDSTLITIECVDEIADMMGIRQEVAAITASAMRGEIDFRESLTRRVALLRGLDIAALQRVYDERLELSPGAERLLAGMRAVGAQSLLVSGGFTFFTERLKARLGLDHTCANTLEIADGKLTGRLSGPIVDANAKAACFARLRAALVPDGGLAVAIGDGANDLPMLEAADVSVAYHAKPVVRARATYAIDYCGLDAVLNLFV